MRRTLLSKYMLLCCSLIIILLYFLLYTENVPVYNHNIDIHSDIEKSTESEMSRIKRIVISLVACDSRFNESLNVIKSSLLFTRTPIYFVIFSDDNLREKFNTTLRQWRVLTNGQLDFELQEINFPEAHKDIWLNLFAKCASQRLFIPSIVQHIDAMIYVDTDTLFLGPVDELWHYFSKFNSTQISALTSEGDKRKSGMAWYPLFAQHPFYGEYGLNSGVMLMNLTRMRRFGWADYATSVMLKWRMHIPWGDQDIINIIFHYHGGAVSLLPCRYNYRTDQCMYGDACASASQDGIFVLHGSRNAFHSEMEPIFKAMYQAIDEYEIGADPLQTFVPNMQKCVRETPQSYCSDLKEAFLKVPTETLVHLHKTTTSGL